MTLWVLLLAAPLAAQEGASASPWLTAPDAQGKPAVEARPAWAQAAAAALPGAAPWLQSGGAGAAAGKAAPPRIELETDWSWTRVRDDLELVGRLRSGLEAELELLRARRARILVKDEKTQALLPDNEAEAVSIWTRAVDRLVALDSIVLRYRRFDEVQDAERRNAAFTTAFAAYAALARHARDWTAAAADPSLGAALDVGLPSIGLRAGTLSSLSELGSSPERREAIAQALAYSPKAAGLLRLGNAAAFAVAGIKADTRRVRPAPTRGGAVPVPVFSPWAWPVWSAGVWGADDQKATEPKQDHPPGSVRARLAASLPAGGLGAAGWSGALAASVSPFSSPWTSVFGATLPVEGVVAPESTFHRIIRLLVEPSTGTRPAALVSLEQLGSLADLLEPGDILLWRRDLRIDEPGLGGWWTGAGLYVGTPEERERLTKSKDLDGRINTAAPDAYWSSLKPDGGFAKRVVVAAPGGVRLAALERAAAADSVAVLRALLPRESRLEAALRAFTAVGRPHDGAYDVGDPRALYSAELVLWAYAGTPLALEPRGSREAGPPAPNDFARTFDGQYGTSRVAFELIRFVDGREAERRARRRDADDFRLSWKRPRWRFDEKARAQAQRPGE
ncbi:MAG: hypothetical protein HY553_21590 [Elusimicrobia bacterium]|nr:hypothetical protein [Elusimicrobiota bacterium]